MATRHDPADDADQADEPTRAEQLRSEARSDADNTTAATDARSTTAKDTTAASATTAADTAEPTRREKIQGTRGTVQTREQRLEEEATEQRRESAYQLARARTRNRASTDFGLLLLRVLPVTMFLHGLSKIQGFTGFRDSVAQNSFGALAPDLFAYMVVAGQLALPILILLGLLTRISGLLMAIMMAFIWFTTQLPQGLLDNRGGLIGEAAYLFIATSLPLVFTGPGRFSLDHLLTAKRADARAQRRAEKAIA